ncbi:MAG: flagellar protein FlgN [Gammaproteobacteria bacterium]|nr:flagellar protein FlgN [Gammaproteobacteria bacterium]
MSPTFASIAKTLLEQQTSVAEQLLALLQKEYRLLKREDEGDLSDLTQAKLVQVNLLEDLTARWLGSLKQAKVEITLDSIHAALEKQDPGQSLGLVSLWEKLGAVASECQRQNTVNGAILVVREQTTQTALDILRGKVPGEEVTYSAKGRSSGYTAPRGSGGTLGKA